MVKVSIAHQWSNGIDEAINAINTVFEINCSQYYTF